MSTTTSFWRSESFVGVMVVAVVCFTTFFSGVLTVAAADSSASTTSEESTNIKPERGASNTAQLQAKQKQLAMLKLRLQELTQRITNLETEIKRIEVRGQEGANRPNFGRPRHSDKGTASSTVGISCIKGNQKYPLGAELISPSTIYPAPRVVCMNVNGKGVWKSVSTAVSSSTASGTSSIRSGAVRGISMSIPERQRQLMDLHNQLIRLKDKASKITKHEAEFAVGTAVITTDAVKVRARGAGGVLGEQPAGAEGVITGTFVNAANRGWYKVDFVTGPDGWVAATYLTGSVPLQAVTLNFSLHEDSSEATTIVATEGTSETIRPLAFLVSVESSTTTTVAIEKLAVSVTVTGANYADVIETASLSMNGSDYTDVILKSTNGSVTTLIFNINEPVLIENQNEALVELQLVLKDSIANLTEDFTIVAQVSPTDRSLTDVTAEKANITFTGSAVGTIQTFIVTE